MQSPYSRAKSRSQVAARLIRAGKAVQESLVQPAWSHSSHSTSGRMPWGPSVCHSSGMPRRGTPALENLDWACVMATFSSRVMRCRASSTRDSSGWEGSRYTGPRDLGAQPRHRASKDRTTILLISYSFLNSYWRVQRKPAPGRTQKALYGSGQAMR